ncbi:hypothetical protein J6590_107762 [Homalodisca vitripennis]|nr:hypothetical protein J6590_107762 [Homalodisca vitripennis]
MEYSETEYDSEDSSGSEYLLGSESENESEELTPMKRRKFTRKRKRNPENWKKNIRKIKRQRGEEYISTTDFLAPKSDRCDLCEEFAMAKKKNRLTTELNKKYEMHIVEKKTSWGKKES